MIKTTNTLAEMISVVLAVLVGVLMATGTLGRLLALLS